MIIKKFFKDNYDIFCRYNLEIIVSAFARERKILQLNVSLQIPIDFKYDVSIKTLPKTATTNHCVDIHHCSAHDIPAVDYINTLFKRTINIFNLLFLL